LPARDAFAGATIELMAADAHGRDVLEVFDLGLSAVQEHRDAVLIARGVRGVGMVGNRSPAFFHYLADRVQASRSQLETGAGIEHVVACSVGSRCRFHDSLSVVELNNLVGHTQTGAVVYHSAYDRQWRYVLEVIAI